MTNQQLPLPFPRDPAYDARDFMPASSNQDAFAWLQADWPDHRLSIWGQAGCGKTHLLRIWAERVKAIRLSGRALLSVPELSPAGGVALDDADQVASDAVLLHLLNLARELGLPVLLTSREPPARWPVSLPDLSSRLRAVTAVQIMPPGDELLRALLIRLLAERQLVVPRPLQERLLDHLPRSPAALRDAVTRLDQITMAEGKSITRSVVSRLLAAEGACDHHDVSEADRFSVSRTIRPT